jgi:hypothetical protein
MALSLNRGCEPKLVTDPDGPKVGRTSRFRDQRTQRSVRFSYGQRQFLLDFLTFRVYTR